MRDGDSRKGRAVWEWGCGGEPSMSAPTKGWLSNTVA
jgi:hypothetical protein